MSGSLTLTKVGLSGWVILLANPWAGVGNPSAIEAPVESHWEVQATTRLSLTSFPDGAVNSRFAAEPIPASVSEVVSRLKSESGLNADQLGRLLGVSRRSIHGWAAGGSISPAREERLMDLHAQIFNLEATSAEQRRDIILGSTNGPSLFRIWSEQAKANQRIQYTVPIEERFSL